MCFLQTYWNPSGHYITANTGGGRSGIDSNTVLASIHTFDPAAGCDASTFQPCSDKALSNLKVYVDSFRSIYSINNGIASNGAVATGRYPEDVYQGGNVRICIYLCANDTNMQCMLSAMVSFNDGKLPCSTYVSFLKMNVGLRQAVAEQLYDALYVWDTQDSLTVTPISLPFFQLFDSAIQSGTYSSSSSAFTTLTSAIRTFADGFIAIHAKYTPSGGALAEQFTKSNGAPTSAVDLTWSYAAALTGFAARSATNVASWGAAGLTVPAVCNSNSGPTVSVTFNVDATTVLGGTFDSSQLGSAFLNAHLLVGNQRIYISPDRLTRYLIGRLIAHLSCPQLAIQHGAVRELFDLLSCHLICLFFFFLSHRHLACEHVNRVQIYTKG